MGAEGIVAGDKPILSQPGGPVVLDVVAATWSGTNWMVLYRLNMGQARKGGGSGRGGPCGGDVVPWGRAAATADHCGNVAHGKG